MRNQVRRQRLPLRQQVPGEHGPPPARLRDRTHCHLSLRELPGKRELRKNFIPVAPVSNERLDGAASHIPRAFLLLECREIKAIVIIATFISPALSRENVVVKIYRSRYTIYRKWLSIFIISFYSR